ncbi:MAG: hypothetical protein KF795_17040 [Labilithrix sp.]|nr:hypothetical protein [Labilithrix sp.]
MSARNHPNEPGAWDADFSYRYLAELYAVLRSDFAPTLVGDAAEVAGPDDGPPRAFVRHDIDVSLERALPLARLEQRWGVGSTYHVMLESPFYDVRSARSREALAEIASLGHEVGLHYDVSARGTRDADSAARERDIARACGELEEITGAPVRSLSFHLPVKELINGPLRVAGRVSGYASALFAWYISDSRARWREGAPLASLRRPRARQLQILIHPIWWGEEHVHPTIRLRDFLREVQPVLGGTYAELNDKLWDHIIYSAADAPAEA